MALHLTETKPFMAFNKQEVNTMTTETTYTHKSSNQEYSSPTEEVEGYRFLEFENLSESTSKKEEIDMTELKEGTYNFLGLRNRPEDSQAETFAKLSNRNSTTPKSETSETEGYQLLGVEETDAIAPTSDETEYEPQEGTYQFLDLR